ncbi:Nucleoredoxin, partial [Globisporangium splendens]
MEALLENELVTKNDGVVPTSQALNGKKVIGLYFSGSYCPPCRKFTPLLEIVYDEVVEQKIDDFEIVLVSSDREEQKFAEYYAEMPWLALPYEKRQLKVDLCEKFGVKTVPTLIFFNEKGEVVEREGRNFITEKRDDLDAILAHLRK